MSTADVEVLPPMSTELEVARLRAIEPVQRDVDVIAMLVGAHQGLRLACQANDKMELVRLKGVGHALQEIAKQLGLAEELRLDATEFIRRTERALGVAIREGQARGEVQMRGDNRFTAILGHVDDVTYKKVSPTDFVKQVELSGAGQSKGIYAMTDGVTDADFENILTEARDEGNLSRANVARRALMISNPKPPPAVDPMTVRKTAIARRTIESAALTINSLMLAIAELDPGEVDRDAQGIALDLLTHDIGQIREFLVKVRNQ